MSRQYFDFRVVVAVCILLGVYIMASQRGNICSQEKIEDTGRYFLQWNGNLPEIVKNPRPEDTLLIPAGLRPIFFKKIPVNQADCELLETIPGIGPEMAARIVATRKNIGGFDAPENLLLVPGIGLKRKEYLEDQFSFVQ